MDEITFRTPKIDEAAAYRELRLEALKEFPANFSSSYEENKAKDMAYWEGFLRLAQNKNKEIMIMAYVNGEMVGMGTIFWDDKAKICHIGNMVAIYVKKTFQGKGIGYELASRLISEAKTIRHLKKIKLEVNKENVPAFELYKKLGFDVIGTAKQEIFSEGKYYDNILMELLFTNR